MGANQLKIGVLTSSRADFGIYSPLLDSLSKDNAFDVEVIAFGTHLSEKHGYTITEILKSFNGTIRELKTMVDDRNECTIARSYSDCVEQFTHFWNSHIYDLVLCLGDRYEMNAAVQASIPFQVRLAHFHGGEQTLGAIDNIYRHQITLACAYHFTATDEFAERVRELLDNEGNTVFSVGSLSLSDLANINLISLEELRRTYNLPEKPFILCTFHPETVKTDMNECYAKTMIDVFKTIDANHHLLVSMPNADTNGNIFRLALEAFALEAPERVTLVESFGKVNYFSAMKNAAFLLGNSSSGIIEAASFGKYVINVGDRQKGRLQSDNVIDVPFQKNAMSSAISKLIAESRTFSGENKYVKKNTISKVIEILRSIGNGKL